MFERMCIRANDPKCSEPSTHAATMFTAKHYSVHLATFGLLFSAIHVQTARSKWWAERCSNFDFCIKCACGCFSKSNMIPANYCRRKALENDCFFDKSSSSASKTVCVVCFVELSITLRKVLIKPVWILVIN